MTRLVTAYPTHLQGVRRHFLDWLSPAQQQAVADALRELAGASRRDACTEAVVAEVEATEAARCDAADLPA
jgi:hypothetical protein